MQLRSTLRYRVDYSYGNKDLPEGIPAAFTNIVMQGSKPKFVGSVVKVLKLVIDFELRSESQFHPHSHLGDVHVEHLREVASGVQILTASNVWSPVLRVSDEESREIWRIFYLTLAAAILIAPIEVGMRATVKMKGESK